jgi:anti-anti-sigma factor
MSEKEITTKSEGDVTVMAIKGDLDSTLGLNLIHSAEEQLNLGSKKLLLDLSGIDYMNSAGLGALIAVFTKTSNAGGKLILAPLPKSSHIRMQIGRMAPILAIGDSVAEGIRQMAS